MLLQDPVGTFEGKDRKGILHLLITYQPDATNGLGVLYICLHILSTVKVGILGRWCELSKVTVWEWQF